MARVIIPSAMRHAAEGADSAEVKGDRLKQVIHHLCDRFPELRPLILDENGSLHHHLAIFVDGVEIRAAAGLFTEVGPDSEVVLTPALSGGA